MEARRLHEAVGLLGGCGLVGAEVEVVVVGGAVTQTLLLVGRQLSAGRGLLVETLEAGVHVQTLELLVDAEGLGETRLLETGLLLPHRTERTHLRGG